MSDNEEDDGFDAHMAYLEIERAKLKIVDVACCYNCALAEHGYEGEMTCMRTDNSPWGGMGVGPINVCEHHSAIESEEANGNLISAAPELLAALRSACENYLSQNGSKPPAEWLLAVAKAEGRV